MIIRCEGPGGNGPESPENFVFTVSEIDLKTIYSVGPFVSENLFSQYLTEITLQLFILLGLLSL